MRARGLAVAVVAMAVSSACTPSMKDLQGQPADAVVGYTSTDPAHVRDCVKAQVVQRDDGRGSYVEFEEGDRAVLGQQLVSGYGPMGLTWLAEFYPDRAEIRGMKHISGWHGSDLPPMIRDCAA